MLLVSRETHVETVYLMKTLKSLKQESFVYYSVNPEVFKQPYSKRMGGKQTVVIEGIGRFYFDDRTYYKGRGAKYNKTSMHEDLGEVFVSYDEFMKAVENRARIAYKMQKNEREDKRRYKKAYDEAAALVGKTALDKGISLVKSFKNKTYYFIGNVLLYKGYTSEYITIEIVTDEYRASFNWDEWYSAPYASLLGMTPEDKNLFIC